MKRCACISALKNLRCAPGLMRKEGRNEETKRGRERDERISTLELSSLAKKTSRRDEDLGRIRDRRME